MEASPDVRFVFRDWTILPHVMRSQHRLRDADWLFSTNRRRGVYGVSQRIYRTGHNEGHLTAQILSQWRLRPGRAGR
jgi:hypothetical protein